MFTMTPAPCAIICLPAHLQPRKTPLRLMPTTVFHPLIEMSSGLARNDAPALFTMTSSRPSSCAVRSTIALTWSSCRTSTTIAKERRPRSRMAFTTGSRCSSLREQMATSAPALANSIAMDLPMLVSPWRGRYSKGRSDVERKLSSGWARGGGLRGAVDLVAEERTETAPETMRHLHAADLRRELRRLPVRREVGTAGGTDLDVRLEPPERPRSQLVIEILGQLLDRLPARHGCRHAAPAAHAEASCHRARSRVARTRAGSPRSVHSTARAASASHGVPSRDTSGANASTSCGIAPRMSRPSVPGWATITKLFQRHPACASRPARGADGFSQKRRTP